MWRLHSPTGLEIRNTCCVTVQTRAIGEYSVTPRSSRKAQQSNVSQSDDQPINTAAHASGSMRVANPMNALVYWHLEHPPLSMRLPLSTGECATEGTVWIGLRFGAGAERVVPITRKLH